MKVDRHALAIARIEVETGTAEEKARIKAWDRLDRLLSTLDSKTSVLLRFNSIVVAALAYLVIVSATEPFAQSNTIVKTVGVVIGHLSLLASVLSCGFAFPVINVEWNFFGGRLDHKDGGEPRWTLDRIKAYTSHPENRDAIPFIHTKNSISMRGCRIGGLLYPEHEKEIGKIEWRTSIKNNDLYGQYSIFAYSDKNCVIAITSDQAFDKHIPSKEEFEKQLLGDILVFSCRGYWGVLREEYNKTPDKSRFEWCHEAPTGEIDIKRDSDGKPTSFSCKMKSFSIPPKDLILTADTNENFDITNVKINGEVNLGWKELLENRVHYSDKMWQLLDEWKAKRENAEKESQKK